MRQNLTSFDKWIIIAINRTMTVKMAYIPEGSNDSKMVSDLEEENYLLLQIHLNLLWFSRQTCYRYLLIICLYDQLLNATYFRKSTSIIQFKCVKIYHSSNTRQYRRIKLESKVRLCHVIPVQCAKTVHLPIMKITTSND